jgi:hypothetical protein
MMKSRLFSKNSVRCGLNLSLILCFVAGCSSSTTPTYSKADVDKTIERILKDEYRIKVKSRLVGQTLWVYVPLEDILEKDKKPEKYPERFRISENENELNSGYLILNYLIKPVPERQKKQEYKFSKASMEKIGNVSEVLRRVILSMDPKARDGIKFFYLVAADIKNAFEIRELIYCRDMIKVVYKFISPGEYHHRVAYDSRQSFKIVGDKEGRHLNYKNITMGEFITQQIKHRINLKFQKPEAKQGADIDKEIAGIIIETLKIYAFRKVDSAELNNLVTQNKIILKQAEIF